MKIPMFGSWHICGIAKPNKKIPAYSKFASSYTFKWTPPPHTDNLTLGHARMRFGAYVPIAVCLVLQKFCPGELLPHIKHDCGTGLVIRHWEWYKRMRGFYFMTTGGWIDIRSTTNKHNL
jgi:hypothetical protein